MEHKKRKVENGKRNKTAIVLFAIILMGVLITVGVILWLKHIDKSYEIETITEFSYFKLSLNISFSI